MRNLFGAPLSCAAAVLSLSLLVSCGGQPLPAGSPSVSTPAEKPTPSPAVETGVDRPTIPENVAEGIAYLYDFRFSARYDDRVTGDFSLALPEGRTLSLLERYESELVPILQHCYDGDGMVPHMYQRYWYTLETGGSLLVQTDFYEPDSVEYISHLWTDTQGAETNRGVAVGSTEGALLSAYTEDLFYLGPDEAEPAIATFTEDYDTGFTFDCAYAWQPYTTETNDIRDITFYIRDGIVASIVMAEPYELRYVYGYDRDAGIQYANAQRDALGSAAETQ